MYRFLEAFSFFAVVCGGDLQLSPWFAPDLEVMRGDDGVRVVVRFTLELDRRRFTS